MIGEIISTVARTFLEKGIDFVKNSEETKNLRSVYREQIYRELSYNNEILYEIIRSYKKGENSGYLKRLINGFEIEGYETINKSLLPISVLFDKQIDDSIEEYFLKNDIGKQLKETIKKQQDESDLLEYIYRKTKIAMKFNELDKRMNNTRYKHLQTLISLMLNCLKK